MFSDQSSVVFNDAAFTNSLILDSETLTNEDVLNMKYEFESPDYGWNHIKVRYPCYLLSLY